MYKDNIHHHFIWKTGSMNYHDRNFGKRSFISIEVKSSIKYRLRYIPLHRFIFYGQKSSNYCYG